jgi:hypothetical protein
MADKRIYDKLSKINSDKEELVIKLEYKGKVIHSKVVDIPEYAKNDITEEDLSFYYFIKDMALKLEEKIVEIHKKKIWDNYDGERKGNNKGDAK